MKNFLLGLFLGSFVSIACAGIISSPPPLPDEPAAEQAYLYEIFSNIHRPQIITTTPNGNKRGGDGLLVIFNNAGTYELWVKDNVTTTSWQRIN